MKKRYSLLVLVAVLLLVGFIVSTRAVQAVPPISWQPEPFDFAVPPGGRLPTKVTAVVSRDIPATRVEVTPSLAPYVTSIEPATLPALSRGTEVTINLIFEVASGTPKSTYEGTLHLRKASGGGNGTQARPLPMTLTVGDLLYPPDPGEAGKETLEGIDSDGDGVRDDIQRYIELTYPNEPAARAGLRQLAYPLQQALLNSHDKETSVFYARVQQKAEDCLSHLLGIDGGYEATSMLNARALNTKGRSLAYIRHDRQLGGEVFRGTPPEEWSANCEFLGGAQ